MYNSVLFSTICVDFNSNVWLFSFLSCSAAQPCETLAQASSQSPNPNNPAEYCSTIPPLQQAEASGVLSSPPPTVMVPVGVLKQSGSEGMQPPKLIFIKCYSTGGS